MIGYTIRAYMTFEGQGLVGRGGTLMIYKENQMTEFKTIDEILDIAIRREQAAADFYRKLASINRFAGMKAAFEEFAKEELGHKAKLFGVKKGKKFLGASAQVQDLKLGDYLEDPKVTEDIDYQGALVLAMKREKAAFRLYSGLASIAKDPEIKHVFLGLAQEEARHKLRFELEYDDNILRDN